MRVNVVNVSTAGPGPMERRVVHIVDKTDRCGNVNRLFVVDRPPSLAA